MAQTVDSLLKYYEVTWLPYSDGSRVAKPLGHDGLTYRLRKPGVLEETPELSWAWLSVNHPPDDFLCVLDAVRLVSPLVKQIFDRCRTSADHIQWLEAEVITPADARLPYWVPHFPVHHELIDVQNSTFGPSGLPIRYSLDRAKLENHIVTVIPGMVDKFVLAQPVVDALRAANATGVLIMPAPVS